ncbi:MAG: molybdate transport system substrate-binding protein [Pirellulaceae bacterium]
MRIQLNEIESMRSTLTLFAAASLLIVALFVIMIVYGARRNPPPVKGTNGEEVSSLTVYCAAGMRTAFEQVAAKYGDEFGIVVETNFDGSGKLASTISVAEQGDIYIAASTSYLYQAPDPDNSTVKPPKKPFIAEWAPLASQRPVIIVRANDGRAKDIKSIEDLLAANLRIGLADPDVAAVGRAARKALKGTGLWEKLWEAKLTSKGTVNEVANGVETESFDAGIVWDATAGQYPELRGISIPNFEKDPKEIVVAVLKYSKAPRRALHFMRYLTAKEKGLSEFKSLGYDVVDGDKWEETPELLVYAGGLNRLAIAETIEEFEQREGVVVITKYNGCGALVSEMKGISGGAADPDLYFACDTTFMLQVSDRFPISFDVSSTEMVIVVSKEKQKSLQIATLEDLTKPGCRVGVTNPEISALGFLSKQLLEKHDLWDKIQANIADQPATADQLMLQVVGGGLDAAIVYKANAVDQVDKGVVEIPIPDDDAYAIQPIAVSPTSDHKYLATRLQDRIRSISSGKRFKTRGFNWLGPEEDNGGTKEPQPKEPAKPDTPSLKEPAAATG